MTNFPYAAPAQLAELMHQSGLPENTAPANAFRMLAHTPAVGAAALRLVLALLTETDLNPALRELLVLRVTQRCQAWYAWAQHVPIAQTVGVSDAQITALERGEAPNVLFSSRGQAALAFADELLDAPRASEDKLAQVREQFSPREVVELILLTGYFRMISALIATLEIEPEPSFGMKILDQARQAPR